MCQWGHQHANDQDAFGESHASWTQALNSSMVWLHQPSSSKWLCSGSPHDEEETLCLKLAGPSVVNYLHYRAGMAVKAILPARVLLKPVPS